MSKNENLPSTILDNALAEIGPVLAPAATAVLKSLLTVDKTEGNPPAHEQSVVKNAVSLLIGDWVTEMRTRNLMKLISKTGRVAVTHNLNIENLSNLPNGLRYRILDNATKADDPLLQEMWASLLASSCDDSNLVQKKYIALLDQLTGDDARVLCFIYCARHPNFTYQNANKDVENLKKYGDPDKFKKERFNRLPNGYPTTNQEWKVSFEKAQASHVKSMNVLQSLKSELLDPVSFPEDCRNDLIRLGLIGEGPISLPDDNELTKAIPGVYDHDSYGESQAYAASGDSVAEGFYQIERRLNLLSGFPEDDADLPSVFRLPEETTSTSFQPSPWITTDIGTTLYDLCALRSEGKS